MTKGKQGFASMGLEDRRAIASQGGKAAHAKGLAHTWTSGSEASAAGRKGGLKSGERRRQADAVDTDRAGS